MTLAFKWRTKHGVGVFTYRKTRHKLVAHDEERGKHWESKWHMRRHDCQLEVMGQIEAGA